MNASGLDTIINALRAEKGPISVEKHAKSGKNAEFMAAFNQATNAGDSARTGANRSGRAAGSGETAGSSTRINPDSIGDSGASPDGRSLPQGGTASSDGGQSNPESPIIRATVDPGDFPVDPTGPTAATDEPIAPEVSSNTAGQLSSDAHGIAGEVSHAIEAQLINGSGGPAGWQAVAGDKPTPNNWAFSAENRVFSAAVNQAASSAGHRAASMESGQAKSGDAPDQRGFDQSRPKDAGLLQAMQRSGRSLGTNPGGNPALGSPSAMTQDSGTSIDSVAWTGTPTDSEHSSGRPKKADSAVAGQVSAERGFTQGAQSSSREVVTNPAGNQSLGTSVPVTQSQTAAAGGSGAVTAPTSLEGFTNRPEKADSAVAGQVIAERGFTRGAQSSSREVVTNPAGNQSLGTSVPVTQSQTAAAGGSGAATAPTSLEGFTNRPEKADAAAAGQVIAERGFTQGAQSSGLAMANQIAARAAQIKAENRSDTAALNAAQNAEGPEERLARFTTALRALGSGQQQQNPQGAASVSASPVVSEMTVSSTGKSPLSVPTANSTLTGTDDTNESTRPATTPAYPSTNAANPATMSPGQRPSGLPGQGEGLDTAALSKQGFDEALERSAEPQLSRESRTFEGAAPARGSDAASGLGLNPGASAPRGADMPVNNTTTLPTMAATPDSPEFTQELMGRIRMLQGGGPQEARLNLHPAELGRLQITISTEGDNARVAFTVDNPQAREALEQAMPRLRDMLNAAGLELADSSVAQQGQQESGGLSEGAGDREPNAAVGSVDAGDDADADPLTNGSPGDSDRMVDAYA